MQTFGKNYLDGFWFSVFAGFGALAWDLPHVFAHAQTSIMRWQVLSACSGLTLLIVLPTALLLGLLYAAWLGPKPVRTQLTAWCTSTHAYTRAAEPRTAAPKHASILAAPLALIIGSVIAVKVSIIVHNSIRVSFNAAIVLLLTHALSFLVVLLVWRVTRNALSPLLLTATRLRLLRSWLARPWITLLAVFITALIAAVLGGFALRKVIHALDLTWLYATLTATLVAFAGTGLRRLGARLGRKTRFSLHAVGFVTLLGAPVISMFAVSYSNNARAVIMAHTTYSRAFMELQTKLFDRDHDGYTTYFGGNDCQPNNPKINPGAIDIPYNGIDEDCSGSDLQYPKTHLTPRWDYPVPASIRKHMNVILVSVDALNPSHLSYFKYRRKTSPNIDRLAQRSVRFLTASSQGPSTRLSFPSLFLSRYDPQIPRAKLGRIPLALLPQNVTMAERFSQAGYQTIAVIPDQYFRGWPGISQGFRVFDSSALKHRGAKHTGEFVTNAAIRRLTAARKSSQPVFLWVHYYDAHGPYDQPKDAQVFGSADIDKYDAEIQHVDKQVERLVRWLDENMKDRLLIFTADHGESFDQAHRYHHHGFDLHTQVMHIPLFFQASWLTPRDIRTPVSLVDVLPTLANLTGISSAGKFEGDSLVPALLHGTEHPERVTFCTFYLPELIRQHKEPLVATAARTDRYNLIYNTKHGVYTLYDYARDPHETHNLYGSLPKISSLLKNRTQLWRFHIQPPNNKTQRP